jgi:hypothetical protein
MKCGFVLPQGDARHVMEMAVLAEQSGWDAFFVWEPVWGTDAWVSLAAAAVQTESILLGTMLSPLSRMRPWKVASETATLDNLSGGRVILSVGLGAVESGFENFGEVTDTRQRAELMDECLDIVHGLWRGQPFTYEGKHYNVTETDFHYNVTETDFHPPPSPEKGKVTTWIVGLWNSNRSMARTVKYDGILPAVRDKDSNWRKLQTADVTAIRKYAIDSGNPDIDIIVEGETAGPSEEATKEIEAWEAAGATWFIDSMWSAQYKRDDRELVQARIKAGPPL